MSNPILGIVYLATNLKNGKKYVGVTTKSLSQRRIQHFKGKMLISRALRKHGLNNFSWEVIDTAVSYEWLYKKENQYVIFHDCVHPKGYNLTEGGRGMHGITPRLRKLMGVKVKESYSKMPSARKKELNQRRSVGMKAHWANNAEAKEKLSTGLVERWSNLQYKEKTGKAISKSLQKPSSKKKRSAAGKRNWTSLEYRRKIKETRKISLATPEMKAILSEAAKRSAETSKKRYGKTRKKNREEWLKKNREIQNSPEVKAKVKRGIIAALHRQWVAGQRRGHSQKSRAKIGKASRAAWRHRRLKGLV